MMVKIVKYIVGIITVVMLVFISARYAWRIFGFYFCESARVESVSVTSDSVEIDGSASGIFPKSFVGYYAKSDNGILYIGFKFNAILGTYPSDTAHFHVYIPTNEPIREVYIKTKHSENKIWE